MDCFISRKNYSVGFNLIDLNGAAVDSDSTPTGYIYINQELDSSISVGMDHIDTGSYLATFTAPVVSSSATINLLVKVLISGAPYSYWKANGLLTPGGMAPKNNKWKTR